MSHRAPLKTLSAFRCPTCREYDNEVKDSRPRTDGYIHRRRYCRSCSTSFPTIEIPTDLWASGKIEAELAASAEALTNTVTHFNALRRAYRNVRKSADAKPIYTKEPRDV